ncbi:MAG: hypothetical protein J3Q66DRAFT_403859 [Benniella sp.]|nr:MAG: hypothetical protein J3Q66DRAFT_403859 [Benniella sp.]
MAKEILDRQGHNNLQHTDFIRLNTIKHTRQPEIWDDKDGERDPGPSGAQQPPTYGLHMTEHHQKYGMTRMAKEILDRQGHTNLQHTDFIRLNTIKHTRQPEIWDDKDGERDPGPSGAHQPPTYGLHMTEHHQEDLRTGIMGASRLAKWILESFGAAAFKQQFLHTRDIEL